MRYPNKSCMGVQSTHQIIIGAIEAFNTSITTQQSIMALANLQISSAN